MMVGMRRRVGRRPLPAVAAQNENRVLCWALSRVPSRDRRERFASASESLMRLSQPEGRPMTVSAIDRTNVSTRRAGQ